jgi:cellobiose-specific phosphotransferase system component IIC
MGQRLIAPLLILVLITGCAGSIRDNVRKSVLVTGEVALSIDQAERDVYATGVYDAAKHKQIGAAILVMLTAVRAYERAVAAWPDTFTMPSNVPQAMADALSAIAAVERIVEGIPQAEKLRANLNKAKLVIGGK